MPVVEGYRRRFSRPKRGPTFHGRSQLAEVWKHEEVLAKVEFLGFTVYLLAHANNLQRWGTIGLPVLEPLLVADSVVIGRVEDLSDD
jgi:hypothetical protein